MLNKKRTKQGGRITSCDYGNNHRMHDTFLIMVVE